MKLEPHLPQLPSISELLEHPRVKGVVARINRSTLAQRATGFLEELRGSLVQRAGKVEVPSVAQLAERLARRLLGEPAGGGPVINATGIVIGDSQLTPPLSDAAVHAMVQTAGDYHATQAPSLQAAEELLCELTGAERALVVSSFDAALTLVMSAVSSNRDFILVTEPDIQLAGVDWSWLAARSAAVCRPCSASISAVSAGLAAKPQPAAVVRGGLPDGALSIRELAQLARDARLIDAAPHAGILNPRLYGFESIETLGDRIAAGADVVIADGSNLVGGPSCGIILGNGLSVAQAADHALARLLHAAPTAAASLGATLSAYKSDKDEPVAFNIPVWQLLSAPRANWQQRAERLTPQIGTVAGVASAEAREVRSAWRGDRSSAESLSWAIAVRPDAASPSELLERLQLQPYPVIAKVIDEAVQLDLRSVFPRWDQELIASIGRAAH
jgi:L-seryl-tRNA(Ser) seleniumtransferase